MRRVETFFSRVAALGSLALLGLALLLLTDVLCRAFGAPLLGAQDLAETGLVLVTFGALAALDWEGGHIRVDLLASKLPPRLMAVLDGIYAVLACLLWLGLAGCLIEAAGLSRLLGLASNILSLPKAPVQLLAAGLVAFAGVAALLRPVLQTVLRRTRHVA